ncbi:MAG: hypothetical protein HRU15_04780 [Planctomycetes bacterium]|nr:hypothetical protein [Planctomycetota bacterium]
MPLIYFLLMLMLTAFTLPIHAETLPKGVSVVWDMNKAYTQETDKRASICINGLWRWQPAQKLDAVPSSAWGHLKVPGSWPGGSHWIFQESQAHYLHSEWKNNDMSAVSEAWYQREIVVPKKWNGRRVFIAAQTINSRAIVFVDGKKAGTIHFPAGECDITDLVTPGSVQKLSIYVIAEPLKAVISNFNDSASEKKVKGKVLHRGLCGDVYLTSQPRAAVITNTKIETFVEAERIDVVYDLADLDSESQYNLHITIKENGKVVESFTSKKFVLSDIKNNRHRVSHNWIPERLWDLHTPQNLLTLETELRVKKRIIDRPISETFGFREFKTKGKDFYLNGSRIFISAKPIDSNLVSTYHASYAGALKTIEAYKGMKANFVYSHNYDSLPGTHFSHRGMVKAADDAGMLIALSLPHPKHYDLKNSAELKSYKNHTTCYLRSVQNNPSVVSFAMSHNSLGYGADQDPDFLHGNGASKRGSWGKNNAVAAYAASAFVRSIDSTRFIYHHAGGDAEGSTTANIYLNMAPIQERSDWFETWYQKSKTPLFLVEYGIPSTWNFAMFRGWYGGKRLFGSGPATFELAIAEWSAQFFGDKAYEVSDLEKKNLKWESKQFKAGKTWRRWSYPVALDGDAFNKYEKRQETLGMYLKDNLRAFRMWELSGVCLWESSYYFKLNKRPQQVDFKINYNDLQRPGYTADFLKGFFVSPGYAGEWTDWVPTAAGKALIEYSSDTLAFIAGPADDRTSKDHNVKPGDVLKKQLVFFNNSRETKDISFEFNDGIKEKVKQSFSLPTGQIKYVPVEIRIPKKLDASNITMSLRADFNGEVKMDSFSVNLVKPPSARKAKIALIDPHGETASLLKGLSIKHDVINFSDDASSYDLLIIGKKALSINGPGPSITNDTKGQKILVMEQGSDVLEQRFGFRIQEYGLRRAFPRVTGHPILEGIENAHLTNWQGSATLVPTRRPPFFSKGNLLNLIKRNGLDMTRVWRVGSRGNVASVLIEKPAKGDFLSLLDGAFSLQYTPLMEYRSSNSVIMFSQLDISGRDRSDPVAEALVVNMINYLSTWRPAPKYDAYYLGEEAGLVHIRNSGFIVQPYNGQELQAGHVLIVGPGSLSKIDDNVKSWISSGGKVIGVGLNSKELSAISKNTIKTRAVEFVNAYFEPSPFDSLLAGIGPGELHLREPRTLDLPVSGMEIKGLGALAVSNSGNFALCQVVPWQYTLKQHNTRRVFRRASHALARLLSNAGVKSETVIEQRLQKGPGGNKTPWLDSFYLDAPIEWDDPYRYFRW